MVTATDTLELDIKIFDDRLRSGEFTPQYGKEGDLGVDLRACIDEPVTLTPGDTLKIPVGFAVDMTGKLGGIFRLGAFLIPRSGLGTRGLVLGNLIGLADENYHGQLQAQAWHRGEYGMSSPSSMWRAQTEIVIEPMEKFAQAVFMPFVRVSAFNVVDEFSATTERGATGFGDSGRF